MNSYPKNKGRREGGQFFALPHRVMDSANYCRLSAKAVKLLNDLGFQYNGINNGNLCATFLVMKPRGWPSKSTLEEAIAELLHYGMIMLTRQGGRHKANLYGLTWCAVDDCNGKLDVSETPTSPGQWKDEKPLFVPKRKQRKKQNDLPDIRGNVTRYSGQSVNQSGFRCEN